MIKISVFLAIYLLPFANLLALNPKDSTYYRNWQNLDFKKDKKMGVSLEKCYNKLLIGRKSNPVLVAIIDSGVDIEHEDLKDRIWVNENEIPNNGIDDDNNGYIDDIHGWNFIGNSDNMNIENAPLEVTRIRKLHIDMFSEMNEDEIKNSELVDFSFYQEVHDAYNAELEIVNQKIENYTYQIEQYNYYDSILKSFLDKAEYTIDELEALKLEKNTLEDVARNNIVYYIVSGATLEYLEKKNTEFQDKINTHLNLEFNPRPEIMEDDDYSWTNSFYGNSDVKGVDPSHGTSVAGVIGAVRNNNIGVDGIADNVRFMSLRAVPDGDEWDKDVANAIKYAIDNGAQIINMSFGKSFSPQKHFVDSIVKLVDRSNVLIVHASGNDGMDIDIENNYPKKFSPDGDLLVNNWITVGASTISYKHKALAADFSNYGKQNVDIFAPGEDLLLCTTDNKYRIASGTSFAAPVVTGIATLLKSFFPELSAAEIKEIILNSTNSKDYKVYKPNSIDVVQFSSLSAKGGIVNTYKAILLAEEKIESRQ